MLPRRSPVTLPGSAVNRIRKDPDAVLAVKLQPDLHAIDTGLGHRQPNGPPRFPDDFPAVAQKPELAGQRGRGLQHQAVVSRNLAPHFPGLSLAARLKKKAGRIGDPVERDVCAASAQGLADRGFAEFRHQQVRADMPKTVNVGIQVDCQHNIARVLATYQRSKQWQFGHVELAHRLPQAVGQLDAAFSRVPSPKPLIVVRVIRRDPRVRRLDAEFVPFPEIVGRVVLQGREDSLRIAFSDRSDLEQ